MAHPIEPTPALEGEDAERLLADIAETAPPEEIRRRVAAAKEYLARVMRKPEGQSSDALWLAAWDLAERARMILKDGCLVDASDECSPLALNAATTAARAALARSFRPRGSTCPCWLGKRNVILTAGDGGINVECRGCGTKWMEDMSR